MITYKITGDDISISESVRDYVEKRFAGLERFMEPAASHEVAVNLLKTTAHQRDNTNRVEVSCVVHGKDFFVAGEGVDVHAAIDEAKDELMREITHTKDKRASLFHRGARKLKRMMQDGFGGKK